MGREHLGSDLSTLNVVVTEDTAKLDSGCNDLRIFREEYESGRRL